jgi:hypothetical protein
MKKQMLATIVVSLLCATVSLAQNNYMDNALNYNRLLREKTGDGVYKMVGTFKVVGTPYLFGEKNKGDLFSSEAKAYNISLSYNTFNQEVEFYSTANPDKPLVREPGTVDSFIVHSNATVGITSTLKFIYGGLLGSSEKAYFLEIYSGPKYSVYKRYKSDLGYVSSNYIQSELRQFDLLYDYFYIDAQKKSMKKLKTNSANIIKEFKNIKDITPVFNNDEFTVNQEAALRKAFVYLNL